MTKEEIAILLSAHQIMKRELSPDTRAFKRFLEDLDWIINSIINKKLGGKR